MIIKPCEICGENPGTQRHHCFPQFKRYRKKYGDLLDADFNVRYVCADCHTSHRNVPRSMIWDEDRFLFELQIWQEV